MNYSRTENNMEVYFPRYGLKSDKTMIDIINQTQYSLEIAIFNFTDKKILNAILSAKKRGIDIRVITDKLMSITPLQFIYLKKMKKQGIVIKRNKHKGFMHLKISVSDKKIITVASANFTVSAQTKNDDVFLVFRDKSIAAEFCRQFEMMWDNQEDFQYF